MTDPRPDPDASAPSPQPAALRRLVYRRTAGLRRPAMRRVLAALYWAAMGAILLFSAAVAKALSDVRAGGAAANL